MKILLVDNFEYINSVYKNPTIPVGLLNLATILHDVGYEVEIVNFNYLLFRGVIPYHEDSHQKFEHMADYLLSKTADLIGFSTVCGSIHNAIFLSRIVKEKNPNLKIIFGGPQASSVPEKILKEFGWIDLICVGEGENNIVEIVRGLENGNVSNVPGIVYRSGENIIRTRDTELVQDLDTLPMPNYRLIPSFHEIKDIIVETGRGCPYRCTYCSTADFWKHRFRLKSVERIVREITGIKEALEKERIYVNFIHDNLTTDRRFIQKLCTALEALQIDWGCNARLDTIDEALIGQMARAGCQGVLMGIETGSARMQKLIRKNLDLNRLRPILDCLLGHGIKPVVSFMYGFPGETEEDLRLTLKLVDSIFKKGVYCHMHSLGLLTGTQMYHEYKDRLALKDFFSNITDISNYDICKALICEHPEIFPHFYILEGSLVAQYPMLDIFLNFIFSRLYGFFPETFNLVLETLDHQLLDFYKDFVKNTQGAFMDFFRNMEHTKIIHKNGTLMKKSEQSEYIIDFLTIYINTKSLNDMNFRMIRHTFCTEKERAAHSYKKVE